MDLERPANIKWNGHSLAERDRRWRVVRENTAKENLECIFVPFGNWQDAR